MTTLLRDLIDIPTQVNRGDLVMELSSGVTHPQRTVDQYVVTDQLADSFDQALGIVAQSARDGQSRAAYLHGSFGSGKSHFMAVLHLLLQGEAAARSIAALARVLQRHDPALAGTRWLLVPFHMIGKEGMEQAILGGYAEHVARLHPEAPPPAVYVADDILANSADLRRQMGDERFFAELSTASQGGGADGGGWGDLATGWTPAAYDAAMAPAAPRVERDRLSGDLLRAFFPAYGEARRGDASAYHDLDSGLAAITRHAKALGYDGIVLFLDELILWLASHLGDQAFVNAQAPKVAKLRESQDAAREVPIVSFVARQRDLRELVGEHTPGAEQLAFADSLKWWEGRFDIVRLEDRNLPEIASRRLLAPVSDDARAQIDAAFVATERETAGALDALLTSDADRAQFRHTYPFSPAFMAVLVALSSALQRQRTALRVLLELLSRRRDDLELGQLVGVGEIWDVVAESTEPFSDAMRATFQQADKLYREKLRPLLLEQEGLTEQTARELAWSHRFAANDRIVKTLLIAALVPEVEPLRGLDAQRLAALNHGSITSRIAGKETAQLVRRLRDWSGQVGELKVGDDPHNPSVNLQLTGVDVESILERAKAGDTAGDRRLRIKELLFADLQLADDGRLFFEHRHLWRGAQRHVEVVFGNIRDESDVSDAALRPHGDGWRLVLDFPFDQGHHPSDDLARLERWQGAHPEGARTVCWVPSFFTLGLQEALGRYARHAYLLSGERFEGHADHLSQVERHSARQVLETQRSALEARLRSALRQAYGIEKAGTETIDTTSATHEGGHVVALRPGFAVQKPIGATLKQALDHLLDQCFDHELPRHPRLEGEARPRELRMVLEEVRRAVADEHGRIVVESGRRGAMRALAQPLGLGTMHETAFELSDRWARHVGSYAAGHPGEVTVGDVRRWLDEPEALGLTPPVSALLVMVVAEQLGRRFTEHGGPAAPTLERLGDHLVLAEQALPDEQVWTAARDRGQAMLGLTPNPARTPTSVGQLAEDVAEKLRALSSAAVDLPGRLGQRLATLGVRESARLDTAGEAAALVHAVVGAGSDAVARLEAYARAPLDAPVETVGTSLVSSAAVLAALDRDAWDTLGIAAGLAAHGDALAREALRPLCEALERDELAVALEPRVTATVRAVNALLAERVGGGTRPGTEPRPGPDPAPVANGAGKQTVSGVEEARAVVDRLTDHPDAPLDITIAWRPAGR
jgi:hypothetical protein